MSSPNSILRIRRGGNEDENLLEFSPFENVESKNPMGETNSCSVALDESDLECSLCLRLFHDPVTTPCGHTYCKLCLRKALEYGTNCPLCRHFLCSRHQELSLSVNFTLISILKKNFPQEYKLRAEEDMLEELDFKEQKKFADPVVPLVEEPEAPQANCLWCVLCRSEPIFQNMVST